MCDLSLQAGSDVGLSLQPVLEADQSSFFPQDWSPSNVRIEP